MAYRGEWSELQVCCRFLEYWTNCTKALTLNIYNYIYWVHVRFGWDGVCTKGLRSFNKGGMCTAPKSVWAQYKMSEGGDESWTEGAERSFGVALGKAPASPQEKQLC